MSDQLPSIKAGLHLDASREHAEVMNPDSSNFLDQLPWGVSEVLRDYQKQLIADAAARMKHQRRILWQAPTGSGNTVIIGAVVAAAQVAKLRVLILATRTR